MSFRYGQFCPIAKASEILGERWTLLILRELLVGSTRYSDLQRGLARISPTLLTKRLGQLVAGGLVERTSGAGVARAEYRLTAAGRALRPAVLALGKWALQWSRGPIRDEDLDAQLLMLDLSRRLDVARLPVTRAVIGIRLTDRTDFPDWWLVIEPRRMAELCVDHPGKPVDLHLRATLRDLAEFWRGDFTLTALLRSGRVTLAGERALARTITTWLRPGLLAAQGHRRSVHRD